MSFPSDFTDQLLTSIATITSIASEDVYPGLADRNEGQFGSPEVRVEYRGHDRAGRGSGDGSKLHLYTLHLLLRDQVTNQHTWQDHLTELEALAEALVGSYDGACPFVSTIATVVQAKASVGEPEVPDGTDGALRLPVLLEVHEK